MKKIIIFILVFFATIVLFMPKINLYNTIEKFLKEEQIVIKEEKYSPIDFCHSFVTLYFFTLGYTFYMLEWGNCKGLKDFLVIVIFLIYIL